jgi:ribulose-5-phosphate 4-epimerase/fuculose-1-phosphate aldolase
VAEAFYWMWYLEQSCRIQLAAQAGGVPLAIPSRGTVERTRAQFSTGPTKGWLPWQALKRKLDREQPDYKD